MRSKIRKLSRRYALKIAGYCISAATLPLTGGKAHAQQSKEKGGKQNLKSAASPSPLTLHYSKPAEHFNGALPVGNGRLGLMVYGGVSQETLHINDDTLWSGGPRDYTLPDSKALLPEIRKLLFAGQYQEASELTRKLQGPDCEAYVTTGELCIDFDSHRDATHYKRQLDLNQAVSHVRYESGQGTMTRETFVSNPAGVAVTRIETHGDPVDLTLTLNSPHPHTQRTEGDNTLILSGYAPHHVKPHFYTRDRHGRLLTPDETVVYKQDKGIRFEIHVMVRLAQGSLQVVNDTLTITQGQAIEIFVATGTSYAGWDRNPVTDGCDPSVLPRQQITEALNRSYETLKAEHIADHQSLFNRFTLQLGNHPVSSLDTDEQIKLFAQTEDPNFATLLCQYGRYLTIAGSRPGSQALNLQGIWSDYVRPPWNCNYTTNINVQMNYWPSELTHLAECHEPMIRLTQELAESGKAVARVNYGARGWVADHNTDLWRITCPVGDFGMGGPKCSIWPMAGAWFCQHVFDHYAYGLNEEYLRDTAYPLMKGAAEFFLDFLVEDEDGQLVTAPSTSPENEFQFAPGKRAGVAIATTMDMSLLFELFSNCITACETLKVDPEFKATLIAARSRLRKPKIGQYGQLTEWAEDWDDPDDKHRHLSHLYGLYPGNEFTLEQTPKYFAAARKSLEMRGDEATGWSFGWKINLWARLRDGERAYRLLKTLIRPVKNEQGDRTVGAGLYANLFDAHPPFQIDGNFGATAGIVEMLIQKVENAVLLLPANCRRWDTGQISGVRLRGGITVGFAWKNGKVTSCTLTGLQETTIELKANQQQRAVHLPTRTPVTIEFAS